MLAVLTAALALAPAAGQAPRDVPSDHWAYAAVQDLAGKGLIKGYPASGDFFGKRTVTRYEMATVVQRALARVEDLLAQKADKGEQAPAPAAAPVVPGVSQAQLDEVRKLVDEFKVELTVIGTDLQKVRDELAGVKGDVDALKGQVALQTADIAEVKQTAADGKQGLQAAIDAIQEQAGRVDKLNSSKVEAGFGKMKIGGLLQLWYQDELSAPSKGVTNGFRMRRSEIKFSGNINPRTYWTAMIDPAKSLSLNTTASGGNLTGVSVNNSSTILQDMVVGSMLTPSLAIEFGQQKVPMSMEGMRSSSQLLTVERAIFNTLPANNGRVGDIRDLGAMLRLTSPQVDGQLAVFNDAGNRQNSTDDNNQKEILWHAQYKGLHYLTLGGYQEFGGGVNGQQKTQRQRLGLEAVLTLGKHRLEAEAVQARDGAPAVRARGGYLTYVYRQSPMWEGVVRGEYWNPNRALHNAAYTCEYDLTVGINHYLSDYHAKIQLNWVRKNIVGPLNTAGTGPSALSSLGLDRSLFLVNFQQAF